MRFLFLLLLLPLFSLSQITDKGIEKYTYDNGYKIFLEFQDFHHILIDRDLEIQSDDILLYSDDTSNVGKYIPGLNLLIISNNSKRYYGYSVKDIKSKREIKGLTASDMFVKSVILHEICHSYLSYIVDSMKNEIRKEYRGNGNFNSYFIEEGICEWSVKNMGELSNGECYVPNSMEDLMDSTNYYDIKYEYSVRFVEPIMNKYGLKLGTILLFKNKPPTYEEMLKPEIYYKRIKFL